MSRKKPKQTEAVPEEILAEGSGPADASSDPDAQELANALSDLSRPDSDTATGRDGQNSDALDGQSSDVLDASDDRDSDDRESDDQDSDDRGVSGADELDDDGALSAADDSSEGVEAGAVPATTAATMDEVQLRHLVEALIFAADRPISLARLRQLTRISDVRRLEQAVAELAEQYRERGIALQQVSGGYQFRTNTGFSPWVQQLIAGRPVRLSRAQLETLAIVAYRQPITRPEIDEIRGVDSSATLRLLLDRALIRVLGKREEVGRPILYGTTKEFLDFFSLGELRELPTLREYSELSAESRQVMSDRLGVPLAPEGSATVVASASEPPEPPEPPQTFEPDVAEPGSEPSE